MLYAYLLFSLDSFDYIALHSLEKSHKDKNKEYKGYGFPLFNLDVIINESYLPY